MSERRRRWWHRKPAPNEARYEDIPADVRALGESDPSIGKPTWYAGNLDGFSITGSLEVDDPESHYRATLGEWTTGVEAKVVQGEHTKRCPNCKAPLDMVYVAEYERVVDELERLRQRRSALALAMSYETTHEGRRAVLDSFLENWPGD